MSFSGGSRGLIGWWLSASSVVRLCLCWWQSDLGGGVREGFFGRRYLQGVWEMCFLCFISWRKLVILVVSAGISLWFISLY